MRQRHSRDERWCFVVRQTDQPQTVGVLTSRHKEAWMFLSCTAWSVRYVTIRFFEHVEALCLSNICFYGVDMLGLYRTIEDMSKKSSKYEIRFSRLNWKHSKYLYANMIHDFLKIKLKHKFFSFHKVSLCRFWLWNDI